MKKKLIFILSLYAIINANAQTVILVDNGSFSCKDEKLAREKYTSIFNQPLHILKNHITDIILKYKPNIEVTTTYSFNTVIDSTGHLIKITEGSVFVPIDKSDQLIFDEIARYFQSLKYSHIYYKKSPNGQVRTPPEYYIDVTSENKMIIIEVIPRFF